MLFLHFPESLGVPAGEYLRLFFWLPQGFTYSSTPAEGNRRHPVACMDFLQQGMKARFRQLAA
jgi:hypothetical protein